MSLPTLLLTRPRHSALEFVGKLNSKVLDTVEVLVAPLLEIAPIDLLVSMDGCRAVIFTSVNGTHHAPEGHGRTAYCVGAQTTKSARARGWKAHQSGDTAQQLIAELLGQGLTGPLLHLGGEHTRGDVAKNLTSGGIETTHIAVYRQTLLPLHPQALEALKRPCIIPVFSPRTAQQLNNEADGYLEHAHIVALSGAVAAPFVGEKCGNLSILPAPRTVYMVKAVENLCATLTLP